MSLFVLVCSWLSLFVLVCYCLLLFILVAVPFLEVCCSLFFVSLFLLFVEVVGVGCLLLLDAFG